MKKLKRVATLFLSVMMFFSCLFFVGCTDESTPGTYHLTHMTFEEGNETVNINLNILVNMISGYSMQLVLHEDDRAELKQKQENVETITRGSWSERENGDLELLFEDQLTVASRDGTALIIEDETSVMTFRKFFLDFDF